MHKSKKKKKGSYLNGCLEDFGFPGKIINLIMFFVSSSSLSIIWNGKRLPKIPLLEDYGKGTLYLPICLLYVWKNYPLLLMKLYKLKDGSQ